MINAAEVGIRRAFLASAALVALCGQRFYSMQAPENVALPYVTYQIIGGGSPNVSPRAEFDLMVTVNCVATDNVVAGTSGAATAKTIAGLVDSALHNRQLDLPAPWSAWDCQNESVFEFVENVDRIQYYFVGGVYRVRGVAL